MAFQDKQELVDSLVARFGEGNVDVSDDPLPASPEDFPGMTRHRIRYLDEAGNSGTPLAATAVKKADGTWITINEVRPNAVKKDALATWVDDPARPWKTVTEIRHQFERNSAKIEVVFTGPLRQEVHQVAFVSGSYVSMKVADGPFPI